MNDSKPTKDTVLIGPQLAVQQYLDELLQEATSVPLEQVALDEPLVADEQIVTDEEAQDDVMADEPQVSSTPMDEAFSEEDQDALDAAYAEFTTVTTAGPVTSAEVEASAEPDEAPLALSSVDIDVAIENQPKVAKSPLVARNKTVIKSDLDSLALADADVDKAPVIAKTEPLPWSKSRFECLLFKVGGLKMAVPLVELGGIQKADKSNLTQLFGQPSWFMGVAQAHDMHIRTVDTALWVMPNHYQGDLKEHFKFVIQLDRSDWGLACEVVAEAITLEPSAVKWRSDRSKRPWLAGTVIEHMCAILDVQGFIELLNDPKNGFKAHLK